MSPSTIAWPVPESQTSIGLEPIARRSEEERPAAPRFAPPSSRAEPAAAGGLPHPLHTAGCTPRPRTPENAEKPARLHWLVRPVRAEDEAGLAAPRVDVARLAAGGEEVSP